MKRSTLVLFVLVTLTVVGTVIYLARPRPDEFDTRQHDPGSSPQSTEALSTPTSVLASCIAPGKDLQHATSSLDAQHSAAVSLVAQKLSDAALTEFRNIASVDPGYPGINLDIADALLQSKHAAEANDAVQVQLGISSCLLKLPESYVQAYCESQTASITSEGCRSQLASILERSQHEATLVRVEQERTRGATLQTNVGKSATPVPREISAASGGNPATTKAAVFAPPVPAPAPASEKERPTEAPRETVPVFKTAEASAHIGERARVCGVVVSKKFAEDTSGKPTFINLDRPFPEPTFTVVVWEKDLRQTGTLPDSGELCVTGTLLLYRGTPEIVVHSARDWTHGAQP